MKPKKAAGPSSARASTTRPHSPAPALARSRGRIPVVSLVMSWYTPEIHAGVLHAARDFGWTLDDSRCWGYHDSFYPRAGSYDGALVVTAKEETLEWLETVDVPAVRILDDSTPGRAGTPPDRIPTVVPDMRPTGTLALDHLLSLGMPHLAAIWLQAPNNDNSIRTSFMAACRDRGIEPRVIQHPAFDGNRARPPWPDSDSRQRWLREQLQALPLPCALVTGSDSHAADVVTQARALGLRVPQDLAVLGTFDLKLVRERLPQPLSSINVNFEGVAYEAGRILDAALRGEMVPRRVLVPGARLIERETTSAFHSDDPRVARAVTRIRRDYALPLTLGGLAKEAGLSPRALQLAFTRLEIPPVRDLLVERRVAAAVNLLKDTDMKLESIAMESGLGTATNLCRVIKKRLGITPGELR